MPLRKTFPGLVLALLLGLAGAAATAEDDPPRVTDAVGRAFEDLRSPAERTRREAVLRLQEALPDVRPALIEALEVASPAEQVLLVEVLVHDGSPAAVRAVLRTLVAAEPEVALRVRQLVVADPEASASVLAAWKEEPDLRAGPDGRPSERVSDLEGLLRRVETERIFLGRKSKTGSTGTYRGQYEVLRPYREEALALCVGLLTDRELPEPGLYPADNFHFLRPMNVALDIDELRSMAAHALSELGQPTDLRHLSVLSSFLDELHRRVQQLSPFGDRVEFLDAFSRYSDLLVALYLVRPDHYQVWLDDLLRGLRENYQWRYALTPTYRALVLLRVGRYAEAIPEYEESLLDEETRSAAATHYNLACAYAQWGETFTGTERTQKRRIALYHLTQAVRERWSDIGWMEEDRDLDPIRDTDTYRDLVEEVRRDLIPR